MKVVDANEEGVKAAAFLIREGGVVVYPTETVYGLGCLPSDPDATRRICEIKGRADKPLPLICSDIEHVKKIVEMNPSAEKLAARFWPGPLTLVLPSKVKYSMWVTHGAKTLGVRVTSHPVAQKLALLSRGVIVSTSANISGEEPAMRASEAADKLGAKVDLILDGGPSQGGQSSTVVDLSGEEAWLLREGPVTRKQVLDAMRA